MSAPRLLVLAVAALGLLGPGACAAVAAAKGAGATLPQPAYARWAALFLADTGEAVTYEGSGSGAGVKAVEGAAATFGASDVPLAPDQLEARGLVQFPTLVGGVVPVANLPGIGPGELVLDGAALSGLFTGRIAFWDDPALAKLNPRLPLPHLAVLPVRRSDASGTTAVFAAYLSGASGDGDGWFREHPGELRPAGAAAEGTKGVADAVAAKPGAVGYVGFDYAQAARLAYADLVNPAGRVVQPTLASIAAAAASADWSASPAPALVARPGGASWPIVTATYVLMRRANADDAAAGTALRFFDWAEREGGPAAEDLGFVPLSDAARAAAARARAEVGDASGRPLASRR